MVRYLVACPILLALYLWFLIIFCYVQGLLYHHFDPIWPLVSDSGNYIPEAAIFSWTIVVIGTLFMIISITRYLQLKSIISSSPFEETLIPAYFRAKTADNLVAKYRERFLLLNRVTLICGLIMSYSSMAVGCFRFGESFFFHNLVASGVFLVTPFYMAVHVYISRVFLGYVNSRGVYLCRLVVTAVAIVYLVIFIISAALLATLYHKQFINPVKRLFWSPSEPGFTIHVINSITEWAYLLLLAPFVYTFADEFSRIKFERLQCDFVFLEPENSQI